MYIEYAHIFPIYSSLSAEISMSFNSLILLVFVSCSPHIHSLYERIRVNGIPISENEFDSLVEESKSSIELCQKELGLEGSVSHFEVLTALAFKHFEHSGIDVGVVEAGLGGVRDATNVFDSSQILATVVVPIGMDHAAALGGTIESIAAAKAGIIKHKVPVIVARQSNHAAEAIVLREASIKESTSTKVASSVLYHIEGYDYPSQGQNKDALKQTVLFQVSRDEDVDGLLREDGDQDDEIEASLHLVGAHQAENAATAVTTALYMATHRGMKRITMDSIKDGLAAAKLEGRFEIIGNELDQSGLPLYTIVDGAHNEDSALCLSQTTRSCFPHAQIALVLAMASDKDHYGFCREIQKMEPSIVVFTDVAIAGTSNRSAAPGVLAGAWQGAKMNHPRKGWRCRELIQASIKAAVSKARHELTGPTDGKYKSKIILISGSLHAIGAAEDI